ncbi:YihY/virulence factor BrkB family protein [Euzebya sp.]|uniref:YihY/virulence factor BrkB family protein n=1 Tax=Euzebya sp. TaxID=1971409 RepID=UPI003511644F
MIRRLLMLFGIGLAARTVLASRSSASDRPTDPETAAGAAGTADVQPVAIDPTATGPAATGPTVDEVEGTGSRGGADGHLARTPTEISGSGWVAVLKRTGKEVSADNVPMIAAAVAFAGLLALFPAMIAAISIYGLVTDPGTAAQHAADLAETLPASARDLISTQLESIADSESSTLSISLVVSILGALWSASGGVGMLVKGLNLAYDETDDRGFVKGRALALALTLGAIVFFGVAVGLIAVVPPVIDSLGLGVAGTIGAQVARWTLLALLIVVSLAVLYRLAPDREDARWSWLSPGAVLATVLFLLVSVGFSFFVDNFGSYGETYGAIAGVIVLMLWLQLSALVILVGAELNAESERQTARDTTTGAPRPLGQRGAEPADTVAA